ncbi:S41 family peptidase [Draconibacterium halophilum]|uniref:PDZ domain-containing protein n=1 Tax=Draconibacterium halophilum TaxID=2706887 RepID=A0A6C0RBI5_9BACT|nr:S41 family peptidase [Draconibacterium halophilum]QIA07814.1 PDZ domain-containing protein [Draconibacterium halophilum]
MKNLATTTILFFLAVAIFIGCSKDDPSPDGPEASEYTKKINKFIYEAMNDIYLWYDELPDIDYKYENDPKAYFTKLLYVDDKWSYITDDVDALEASFEGTEKTYGWSLAFYNLIEIQKIVAIVEYVYPETPASAAGFKRGDILMKIDGNDLSQSNYRELLYSDQADVTIGIPAESNIVPDTTIRLTSSVLTLNPVLTTNIVEHDGRKIGYIFYAQFISDFNNALDEAFASLISQGATDLVVDLRYNPGGTITAAQHLCSCIAPVYVVDNNSILVTYKWNDKYQDYFIDRQIMSQVEVYFDNQVPTKMGLNRVHFLTGSGTASASELSITGLKAYMNEVVTVGDTTYGKYTASITLKPEDYYNETYSEEIANWGLQPIVLRYANAAGVTDFKNGFAPDIPVDDDLFATFPLGDKNDPLFKAAIEDITGTPVVAMKSAPKVTFDYKIFDRGFSRFDANKREMLIEQIQWPE